MAGIQKVNLDITPKNFKYAPITRRLEVERTCSLYKYIL